MQFDNHTMHLYTQQWSMVLKYITMLQKYQDKISFIFCRTNYKQITLAQGY